MRTVKPGDGWTGQPDLFLAGGISNCGDWQSGVLDLLGDLDITVANPRRDEKVALEGPEASAQISWEHRMLQVSRHILFWFPSESICPITLLELGVQFGRGTVPLSIGTDPAYARRFDLVEQLALARRNSPLLPDIIHGSLGDTVADAVAHLDARPTNRYRYLP